MKTQIIRLEPHDDLNSARDKMTWGQTGRILLVWPESSRILHRRLDLILLQRHSSHMGAQLALVSHDSEVRSTANEIGIPIYRTLRQAQNAHWRLPRRLRKSQRTILPSRHSPDSGWQRANALRSASPKPAPRQLAPALRLAFFSLGVLSVLALAGLLLPTAELELPVETRSQSITLTLLADPAAEEINLAGAVPAVPRRVIVEGRSALPVTGLVSIPHNRAAGTVQFTNLTDEAVVVPAGTVIRSQGSAQGLDVRFTTTAQASVPAGTGETAQANVQAVQPGTSGNLPANQLAAIEGMIGARVSVSNPRPTRGGSDRSTQAPSQEDREALYAEMLASLTTTAREELQSGLAADDLLIPSSLVLARSIEESYEPKADLPADFLGLHLRLEFEALVVLGADVHKLSEAVLDANLPDGFIPAQGEVSIQHRSTPVGGALGGEWQVYAARTIEAELDPQQVVELSLGRTPAAAAERLTEALPLRAPPQIELYPSWWPRLPVLPFRIHVQPPETGSEAAGEGQT